MGLTTLQAVREGPSTPPSIQAAVVFAAQPKHGVERFHLDRLLTARHRRRELHLQRTGCFDPQGDRIKSCVISITSEMGLASDLLS